MFWAETYKNGILVLEKCMFYITGDTHRNFWRINLFCTQNKITKDDVLIILGDAGINYEPRYKDAELKEKLSKLPITFFCVHGNHEMRPFSLGKYTERAWNGGIAYIEAEFPSLVFAKDGEYYNLGGKSCLALGGAYSVDKHWRTPDKDWWADEQPSNEIKGYAEKQLALHNWQADAVLSHTCPYRYIPRETFIKDVDQSMVDDSTERWLGDIEKRLNYNAWYCGHWHIQKTVKKLQFMYENIKIL